MMAVADHVQRGTPPPPALTFAWRVQKWGDPWGQGWMNWPAGMVDAASAALNVYQAFTAYERAGVNKGKWTSANSDAWEIISGVMAQRRKPKGKDGS
jgi:hypothetical protein